MSRISEVLKNRNRVERAQKIRRRNELETLRNNSIFKANLFDALSKVEIMLDDADINAVEVEVPQNVISRFSDAIYSGDLSNYEISQSKDDASKFIIRKKFVLF